MRIEIGAEGRNFSIPIPRWVLSRGFVRKLGKCGTDLGEMPAQAVDRLGKELAKLEKTHPGWVLVDVESADGETVKIIL